ncbi:DNA sulfur modification protein DndD [Floridanema aerugineum]|uniref:Nuclease SbcCD subunit C n=1 Tax=Floridaenema aerugineum BLCC-F46 TaxID=3153654 RepID=A0ABV4WYZ1_9CYAN
MIFLELSLENFGPYLGKNIINLRPENDGETRPIILFGGMNGGGKTTLMDAIRLTLYGNRAQCSTRGNLSYSEFLNQSVHRHTPPTGKTRIELTFEHIQEDKPTIFKVVRYWEKEPKDGKDTLGILVYDHHLREWWPDKALTNAWDEYIETLLPLGISNLFLFDGEQVKELAELETPPPLVVDAIRSLLGLELAERLSVDLDILVSRKRKEIAGAKELATLEKLETKFKDLIVERENATQEQGSCQTQLEDKQKALRLAEEKFISEGGKIAGERNQLDQQETELKNQANTTRQTLVELAAGVLPLALITPLLNQIEIQAEKETQQQQAKIEKDALQKRSDRLIQYITKLDLKPKQIEQIKTFLDQEYQELEQAASSSEKPWLQADIEVIEQLENLLKYELKAKEEIGAEKINQLKEIERDIEFLERQLAIAASPEIYEQLQRNVRLAQKELAKAQAAKEMANRRVEESKRELEKTRKEIEQYSQEHIKLRNNQHIITSAAKVQNTLKLFKEKLTLKKLNKLEKEVTQCFCYLLHKTDLVHRVVIDTQTFSLFLYDTQGKATPKHRLSAGEKQLLAISFLWGLARVSGRHLPVAIDTPLGRLDSSHRQNLIERYFPAASHQVILLSTDTEIGKTEVENLRKLEAIAREYLLKYDANERQTIVKDGYFW